MRKRAGDPKRAVGYVRISTSQQELGPKAQRHAIGVYAREHGIRVVRWRIDRCSGSRPPEKRQRFLLALHDLREVKAGVFLIWKRDRFARGSVVMIAAMEESIRKHGAELISTDGVTNGNGPEAELIRRILDAVSSYERMMIRIRTSAARLVRRRRDEYNGGPPPFGYRKFVKGHREDGRFIWGLEPEPSEANTLKLIHKMIAVGMKPYGIAEALRIDQVPCRGRHWHARTIARVVRRSA